LDHGAEGDAWGSVARRLAAAAEALALVSAEQEAARQLLEEAGNLPRGFAGFRAPAMLTLAEACHICRAPRATIEDVLHEAMAAAQNIQDPVFCVRTVARIMALHQRYWSQPDLDISQAFETLIADPAGLPGAALHRIGEDYALREVSEGLKLPLPGIAYQANTLDMLASLYQQPLVALARLNPAWSPDQQLPPNTLVAIPDPGFAPLAAACLAALALESSTTPAAQHAHLIQRLVPLAAPNPTALDALLARLLLARQPRELESLEGLQELPDV
jgi:hypothetical protein